MRSFIVRAIVAAAIILGSLPLPAQSVQEQLLVSPDWLQRRLGIVTVLHIGDAASYDARHIPGAVLIEMASLLVQRNGTPNELPPVDALERVFRAAGVGVTGRIVVYGPDPLHAARAWFTLDYLGQGHRVSLLDGGLGKWMEAGYAVSTRSTRVRPGSFEARPMPRAIVRLPGLRDAVRLREKLGTRLVIIDARPQEQFCGEEAGAGIAHPGHIPGAANIPSAWNLDAGGALKSVADLRTMYHRAGVTRDATNIVYCRTGMQASLTYFVLRYLGYDAALYDGSFIEWSNAGEMTWS